MDEQAVMREMLTERGGEEITFETLRFGPVTVATSHVIEFPRGLIGMPDSTRFVFLHQEDDDGQGPFFWMQCVDDPVLAFVVCEPQIFFPGYHVPLSTAEQRELGIAQEADGLVCVILVVPEDPRQITANLRGPIVINTEAAVGFQLVLQGDAYSVKEPLFTAPVEGGATCSS